MNEKGKIVADLSDEKWLSDLALLCDISHHVNGKCQTTRSTETHLICLGLSELFELS
jgi:hypothetical protein